MPPSLTLEQHPELDRQHCSWLGRTSPTPSCVALKTLRDVRAFENVHRIPPLVSASAALGWGLVLNRGAKDAAILWADFDLATGAFSGNFKLLRPPRSPGKWLSAYTKFASTFARHLTTRAAAPSIG